MDPFFQKSVCRSDSFERNEFSIGFFGGDAFASNDFTSGFFYRRDVFENTPEKKKSAKIENGAFRNKAVKVDSRDSGKDIGVKTAEVNPNKDVKISASQADSPKKVEDNDNGKNKAIYFGEDKKEEEEEDEEEEDEEDGEEDTDNDIDEEEDTDVLIVQLLEEAEKRKGASSIEAEKRANKSSAEEGRRPVANTYTQSERPVGIQNPKRGSKSWAVNSSDGLYNPKLDGFKRTSLPPKVFDFASGKSTRIKADAVITVSKGGSYSVSGFNSD